ncbi:MAG TPA: tetrahydrofolate dehydrogenase/cyclohydrolase catalytic domain-containing protein, partial [Solirubrobacterales bacterium]
MSTRTVTIDGKAVAAAVRARVAGEVVDYKAEVGRAPTLATVIVGEDPASQIYIRNKHRACEEVGMRSAHHELPGATSEAELLELVTALGQDDEVDGILVQLPVPAQIDPDRIVAAIDPGKDVDGLTPANAGLLAHGTPGLVPCTPAGVMELLRHQGVGLEGAEAVVVGRSKLVGVPVARLLLAANATVTVCHSRTRDL